MGSLRPLADPCNKVIQRNSSPATASEGLTQADIDLDRRVAAALVQRRRQVQPQRSERGVIARARAYAVKRRAAKLRQRVLIIAARIDEGDDAYCFGNLDAGL